MSEKESLKEAARRVAELNQRRRSSYSEPVSTEEWEIALFKLETAALGHECAACEGDPEALDMHVCGRADD